MAFLIPSLEVSSISGCRRETPAKILPNTSPRNVQDLTVFKKNSKVLVRVCSRISDLEARVSNMGHDVRLYGQFSALVKPNTTSSSKQNKEDEEKQNYYVNTGYAIRTLREEFPGLFYRELSFEIYRDDIVFKDPLNTFVGIENYKSIFWALRFHGKLFFKALWVDIISVWQPVESTIMVRWTVHGIPRVLWESRGRFDGTSEYKLDKNGKIFEHRVHNIALNAPPKFQVLAVDELILSLGCPSTPKPTYFEISSSSIMKFVPLLVKFTWVRHYLASVLALAQRPEAESSRRT
uniref:NTF2-like domain-containing protein n=1 Tax=Davidia involucrata TaxID=16924 RepID=A0A5B6YMU4_DAVIN